MRLLRLLLALLSVAAACAPRTPLASPTPLLASPTPLPASPTPLPTPTPVAVARETPEATIAAAPEAGEAEATARHRRIFEQLWNTVNAQYVYPDFGGVDWAAVYAEFRARVDAGLSDEQFWQAMREMIDRLGDEHSTFLTPSETQEEDALLQGDLSYVGIGVYATAYPELRRAVILEVFPGGPADEAGLRPHDAILAIDGRAVVDADGVDNLDRLRESPGTPVTLRVKSPGAPPREVRLIRRRVDGALRASGRLLAADAGRGRIGYLMIPTLWDAEIEDSARQALTNLMADGPLDGLIVDMRINGGGISTNLLALLGFFTAGRHGEFAGRDQSRPLDVPAEPVGNSQDVPLIVLIGPDTESYAEVFSGVLRETERARLVGMPTPGNIETIYGYDFEDGSRAWIARETFIPNSGDDWETAGLQPDVTVDARWDEFSEGDDPHVAAALELLLAPAGARPQQ